MLFSASTMMDNGTVLDAHLQIERIAGSLGAEIHGMDFRSLDDFQTKAIREALLEYKVIFSRDQNLSPHEFLSFCHLDLRQFIRKSRCEQNS